MLTPTMHCQTRTIDQVGMNQAAAAEEVDHFSTVITSVSLMLPGKKKKRWRERRQREERHLHKRNKVSQTDREMQRSKEQELKINTLLFVFYSTYPYMSG